MSNIFFDLFYSPCYLSTGLSTFSYSFFDSFLDFSSFIYFVKGGGSTARDKKGRERINMDNPTVKNTDKKKRWVSKP
jgi:hypothetical protein